MGIRGWQMSGWVLSRDRGQGGAGGAGGTVGLDRLKGLFQPKQLYYSRSKDF